MELLQLKYFCSAAATQNFSKTARKFMVPPSDISQSIKRLEKELGVKLFDRRANRIFLNQKGEIFYKKISVAINTIEKSAKEIKENPDNNTVELCILIRRHIVMEAVQNFRKLNHSLNFITTHTEPEDISNFDIIVCDKEYTLPHQKTLAAEEHFLLAYNKSFFSGEKIDETLPFITMPQKSSIYKATINICAQLGFKPNIVLESEDPYYIRRCIELGLGVAIVPEISWKGLFSENIDFENVGDYKRNIYVYKKPSADSALSEFHNQLINSLKA